MMTCGAPTCTTTRRAKTLIDLAFVHSTTFLGLNFALFDTTSTLFIMGLASKVRLCSVIQGLNVLTRIW